jgi:hypothetical protein
LTVIELPASRKPASVPRIASGIAEQTAIDAVAGGALEPVIQSAVGIVRESACLLYHIAGLGIALASGPKPKCGSKQTSADAPKNANAIPFPQLETSSRRPKLNRNKS